MILHWKSDSTASSQQLKGVFKQTKTNLCEFPYKNIFVLLCVALVAFFLQQP